MIVDPGGKARRVIGVLSGLEGREQPIELFGARLAMQGHREALEVVHALPVPERDRRLIERTEAITCPELLVVDPMTTFDLAVLVRPRRGSMYRSLIRASCTVSANARGNSVPLSHWRRRIGTGKALRIAEKKAGVDR